MQTFAKKRYKKILNAHEGLIKSETDLTAGQPPSIWCLLMGMRYRRLFDKVSDKELGRQLAWRRLIHPVFKRLLPAFMSQKQVIENRTALQNGIVSENRDLGIRLPAEPVIWMSNHAFKDDTAATLNAAYRHAYILFGSLPQFYNTVDGFASFLNGVVMVNRKVKTSTRTAVERAARVLSGGADLMVFPEGVWNKTPNQLVLPLWPGIYRIAKQTGAKIVPVVHYIRDPSHRLPGNDIHTVVDEPLDISGMDEEAALTLLRDTMASWFYLLMERYGQSSRAEELNGFGESCAAWEEKLTDRVKTADRYDTEIEFSADYWDRKTVRPETAFQAVADIESVSQRNVLSVLKAREIVRTRSREDFQRRF